MKLKEKTSETVHNSRQYRTFSSPLRFCRSLCSGNDWNYFLLSTFFFPSPSPAVKISKSFLPSFNENSFRLHKKVLNGAQKNPRKPRKSSRVSSFSRGAEGAFNGNWLFKGLRNNDGKRKLRPMMGKNSVFIIMKRQLKFIREQTNEKSFDSLQKASRTMHRNWIKNLITSVSRSINRTWIFRFVQFSLQSLIISAAKSLLTLHLRRARKLIKKILLPSTYPFPDPPSRFPSLASARLPAECFVRQSFPFRASMHVPLSSAERHVQSLLRVEACEFEPCNRHWMNAKRKKIRKVAENFHGKSFSYLCSSIGFSAATSNGIGCSSSGMLMSLVSTTERFAAIRASHSFISFSWWVLGRTKSFSFVEHVEDSGARLRFKSHWCKLNQDEDLSCN